MSINFNEIKAGKTMRLEVGHGVTFIIKKTVTWEERAAIGELYDSYMNDENKRSASFIQLRSEVCKYVIIGWEGVNGEDGQPLAWKPEYVNQIDDDLNEKIYIAYNAVQDEDKKKEAESGEIDNPGTDSSEQPTTENTTTPVSV